MLSSSVADHLTQAAVAAIPVRGERRESERGPRQQVTNKVPVSSKHFHILSQNGNLIRDLRSLGVYATVLGKPVAAKTNGAAAATRIDDEPAEEVQEPHGMEWRVIEYGSDTEPGNVDVLLKARDAESLAIAEDLVKEAVSKANKSTKTAYMTFPDRSVFPRIIGSKGSVISELCLKTDAEINVPKDDFTITIYGRKCLPIYDLDTYLYGQVPTRQSTQRRPKLWASHLVAAQGQVVPIGVTLTAVSGVCAPFCHFSSVRGLRGCLRRPISSSAPTGSPHNLTSSILILGTVPAYEYLNIWRGVNDMFHFPHLLRPACLDQLQARIQQRHRRLVSLSDLPLGWSGGH